MDNSYVYYCNGTKKVLTESEASTKKTEIIDNGLKLASVPAVLEFCSQNFLIGPMSLEIANNLAEEKI